MSVGQGGMDKAVGDDTPQSQTLRYQVRADGAAQLCRAHVGLGAAESGNAVGEVVQDALKAHGFFIPWCKPFPADFFWMGSLDQRAPCYTSQ